MKKILLSVLLAGTCLSLVACNEEEEPKKDDEVVLTTTSNLTGNINVYTRDTTSGTREGFFAAIDASNAKSSNDYLVSNASEVDGNGDMISKVAKDESGIGYISLTSLETATGVNGLAFNDVAATQANVLNGTYKMSRWFSYVSIDDKQDSLESQLVAEFNNYLESTEAKLALLEAGVIVEIPTETVTYTPGAVCSSTKTDIKIGGSTSVESASKKVTALLSSKCGAFNPIHAHTGSGDSEKVITSSADMHIGFSSAGQRTGWESDDAEAAKVVIKDLGQDAIVVIVNEDNTMNNITTSQLQEIYVKAGVTHNGSVVAANTTNVSKWEDLEESE